MRSMVYKSIGVVLMIAVGMMIMAAHHEKESDTLASLKEAFNLSREALEVADMETFFSTWHPEGGGVFPNGAAYKIKNADANREQVRGMAKNWNQTWESKMDNLDFNIQGNTAIVTHIATSTNREDRSERKGNATDVWTFVDGKWLRLHAQSTDITAGNVTITQHSINEVWNKGDLSVIDEIFSPNMVQGQKQAVTLTRAAFPDLQLEIDEISAGSNKVTVEWTFTGTHEGEYMGVAATGKKVKYSGIGVATFVGDKIAKTSVVSDSLVLWRQLGVDPPQPPAADSSAAE